MIEKIKCSMSKNIIFILLFFFFGVVVPICYLTRSLYIDESTFLVIGSRIQEGSVLYKDVANAKPPGVFYLSALVFNIVGKSYIALRILVCIIHALSALLIFKLGTKIKDRNIGMISSIIFLIGVYLLPYVGHSFLTEPFVAFFCLLAVTFFLKEKYYSKFISGLALGFGVLFKQTAIFLLGAFFLFYGLQLRSQKNRTVEYVISSAKDLIIIFSGLALPLLITYLHFLSMDVAEGFLHYTVFSTPGITTSSLSNLYGMLFDFLSYLPIWFLSLIMIIVVGHRFLKKSAFDKRHFLLALWILFFSYPAIIGGNHRVLFIIPPASILAALIFENLYKDFKAKLKQNRFSLKRVLSAVTVFMIVISLVTNTYLLFVWALSDWDVYDQIEAAQEVEQYIIDGKMYVFPFQNYLFFFSNLTPRVTIVGGVYSEETAESVVRDLQANNVSYVVAVKDVIEVLSKGEQTLHFPEARQIIYDYIQENYQQVKVLKYYIIYKLKENN